MQHKCMYIYTHITTYMYIHVYTYHIEPYMAQGGAAHMAEPRASKHLASGGSFGSQSAAKATGPRRHGWENHGKTMGKPL